MRIRKNAKISPVTANGAALRPHDCKLNQSPWDAMCFSPPPPSTSTPPPPPQVNGDDSYAGNGSSRDSIRVPKREIRKDNYSGNITTAQPEAPPPPSPAAAEEEAILCGKTDGKSWHCQREASKGNSLCDRHLSQMKSYSNSSSVGPPKKSGKQAMEAPPPPRRGRPKKAPGSSSSSSANPYEFYYYSGFGPRWGKKRGGEICSGSGKNAGHDNESEPPPPPTADEEDDVFAFVDYEDEEEEEEEDEKVRENNGRKRPRKPIKERSLKSLM